MNIQNPNYYSSKFVPSYAQLLSCCHTPEQYMFENPFINQRTKHI